MFIISASEGPWCHFSQLDNWKLNKQHILATDHVKIIKTLLEFTMTGVKFLSKDNSSVSPSSDVQLSATLVTQIFICQHLDSKH